MKMYGGGSREGWVSAPKPSLHRVPGLQDQTGILNQKGVKIAWIGLGVEFIICVYSSPHKAFFIQQNIPENTSFSPGIYGLDQCLSHRAKSSCRNPGIVPSGLDQTEQDGHNSTCSGLSLFATWSESVCVCLLPTDLGGNLLFSEVLRQSQVMGLEWVERDWQEEWSQLAWDTFRVGKSRPSSYSTMSMFYGPFTVFLMETWCL